MKPNWWSIDEQHPRLVLVDADDYMPGALEEIDALTQNKPLAACVRLEVARMWRNWDLTVQLKQAGKALHGQVMERRVRGDKTKWNVAMAGKAEGYPEPHRVEFSRAVLPVAKALYRQARGYLPA